ncbi:hypothetical protein PsYK624_118960 [Phanerochaete sordida]|uniref:Secreted protein n=1 Tax=Phanerochaete sordida TaxID=48140 RepID=A0A9P3LHU8_9APHY|nr:hypothetical protein PsYK624_118960 [Phanerochaete sordida]
MPHPFRLCLATLAILVSISGSRAAPIAAQNSSDGLLLNTTSAPAAGNLIAYSGAPPLYYPLVWPPVVGFTGGLPPSS